MAPFYVKGVYAMSYILANINRPVKFISAGIFKSQDGSFTHPSRVISSFEIILGIDGAMYIEEEGKQYEVERGDLLILYPNRNHKGYQLSGKVTTFYWAHFFFEEDFSLHEDINEISGIQYALKNPFHSEMENKLLLCKYMKNIRNERIPVLFRELVHIRKSGYYTNLAAGLHITSLLVELTNRVLTSITLNECSSHKDILLEHIIQLIEMNYMKKYTISHIGSELGYNSDYIARIFKQKMGMKVSEFTNFIRVKKAQKILLETMEPVRQVCYEVGFVDEKYFMKIFKHFEHISPSEFRRSYYKGYYNTE
jgi:AraC-like DNA-binding protein